MYGIGVLKGLAVTLREFVGTYVDDIRRIPSRYAGGRRVLDKPVASEQRGLFTIQYPEERRKLPERFRYIPMLIYDEKTGESRCTACGICAKACPPQCIWIVRAKDENGKPITSPAEFHIDTTLCMNCGLCAEFCPFDAIKMNHDFEIAEYRRMPELVFDLEKLRMPDSYYADIRPTDWAAEEAAKAAKEAEKAAREAEKAAKAAEKSAERDDAKHSPEEVERRKAEAAAKRAAKATGGEPQA